MSLAMSTPATGLGGDEQHRVAERLDHPAAAGGDHVGAGRLEHLDQVGQLVLVDAVGQPGEADQVGEPDRHGHRMQIGVVGSERLDPARPPPRGGAARHRASAARTAARPLRRRRARSGAATRTRGPRCSSVSTYSLSVATCQSASRAIVRPTARVSRTAVSRSTTPDVDQLDSSRSIASRSAAGEGDRTRRRRGSQAPARAAGRVRGRSSSSPTSSADGQARLLAEDLALEILAGRVAVAADRVGVCRSPAVRLRTSEAVCRRRRAPSSCRTAGR